MSCKIVVKRQGRWHSICFGLGQDSQVFICTPQERPTLEGLPSMSMSRANIQSQSCRIIRLAPSISGANPCLRPARLSAFYVRDRQMNRD
jgi:hypothetical protein